MLRRNKHGYSYEIIEKTHVFEEDLINLTALLIDSILFITIASTFMWED